MWTSRSQMLAIIRCVFVVVAIATLSSWSTSTVGGTTTWRTNETDPDEGTRYIATDLGRVMLPTTRPIGPIDFVLVTPVRNGASHPSTALTRYAILVRPGSENRPAVYIRDLSIDDVHRGFQRIVSYSPENELPRLEHCTSVGIEWKGRDGVSVDLNLHSARPNYREVTGAGWLTRVMEHDLRKTVADSVLRQRALEELSTLSGRTVVNGLVFAKSPEVVRSTELAGAFGRVGADLKDRIAKKEFGSYLAVATSTRYRGFVRGDVLVFDKDGKMVVEAFVDKPGEEFGADEALLRVLACVRLE